MTETYHHKMTTNARMVSKVLTKKKNTFYALRELIDNSINACAKHIYIDFIPTEGATTSDLQYHPIEKIIIEDDGVGVPFNEFDKRIMELATDSREEGNGVGRFSALQIGKVMSIKTVGYDKDQNRFTTTEVTFNVADFRGQLEDKEFDVYSTTTEEKLETGFRVEISSLYNNEPNCKLKNVLTPAFREENFPNSLLEVYHQCILNDKVKFIFNNKEIAKEDFVEGNPHTFTNDYHDLKGNIYPINFKIYTLKVKIEKNIRVFLENSSPNANFPVTRFKYNSVWVAPEQESQYIIITSEYITDDLRDRYDMSDGEDPSWKDFSKFLKSQIDDYYKKSNVKYNSFVDFLRLDKNYPFSQEEIEENGLEIQLFNSSLFMLNNDQDILGMKDKSRATFYKMFKNTLDDGNVEYLVNHVLGLTKESRQKMNELIDAVNLDELIRFTSLLVKRQKELKMLRDITINEIDKYVVIWENGGLKKIINKNFWIFGEQYNGLPPTMKDAELYNKLSTYIQKHLIYKPTNKDNNLDTSVKGKTKKIRDTFIIKERFLGNNQKEVIILFIKSPSTVLTLKEYSAFQNLMFDLQKQKDVDRKGIKYTLLYVGTQISEFAKPAFLANSNDLKPFFLRQIEKNDFYLDAYIYEWNELLSYNEKKLKFMGDSLELNKIDTLSSFIQEYEDSYQPSVHGRLTMEK